MAKSKTVPLQKNLAVQSTDFMKKVNNTSIKFLLIVVFLSYYINITFFPHKHVVNGVTISHSHFYPNSKTNHHSSDSNSTGSFIELIALLSKIVTTTDLAITVFFGSFSLFILAYLIRNAYIYKGDFAFLYFLRGPPFFRSLF